MLTDTSANCTHLNLICHLVLILLLRVDVDVDGGDEGGGGQGILLQGWCVCCREKMILII